MGSRCLLLQDFCCPIAIVVIGFRYGAHYFLECGKLIGMGACGFFVCSNKAGLFRTNWFSAHGLRPDSWGS